MTDDIHILLHNIRSAHNVGSIFRTSDAIGVSKIYLSGYSPLPIDRFGRSAKEITKTALGSEKNIVWQGIKNPQKLIEKLKEDGYQVIAIEQGENSLDYKKFQVKQKCLVLVGNEVLGLSKQLKDQCDVLLEIPMHGKKESLNVSVAFGIVMFRIFDHIEL